MYKNCNMSIFLILITVPIFFLGCSNIHPKPSEYPKWYTTQKNDTKNILYGKAEANTEKEAILSALNHIASKINITIESSFTTTKKSSKNFYSKTTQEYLKNSVQKIDFSNYEIVKQKKLQNGKFIVFVKIRKDILAKSLTLKIENRIKYYDTILKANYSNITSKIKQYKQTSLNIKRIESSVYLLENLGASSTAETYLRKLAVLQNYIDTFNNNITFTLSSNTIGKDFEEQLSSLITQKGYLITNKNPNITIKLTVSKKNIRVLGYKVSKVVINIVAKDKHAIIGKQTIIVAGKSVASFRQANQFAIKNFTNKLIKEDILKKLLGI